METTRQFTTTIYVVDCSQDQPADHWEWFTAGALEATAEIEPDVAGIAQRAIQSVDSQK